MGVILGLVTDMTWPLDDIMWEEIRGGSVVDSPVAVAMLMDTQGGEDHWEDRLDPREDGAEDPGEDGAEDLGGDGEDTGEDGEDPGEDGEELREDPREVIVCLVTDITWEVIDGGTVVERTVGDGDREDLVVGGGSVVTRASKDSWASSNASAFADRAFFSAEEQASTFEKCDKNVHGKIDIWGKNWMNNILNYTVASAMSAANVINSSSLDRVIWFFLKLI